MLEAEINRVESHCLYLTRADVMSRSRSGVGSNLLKLLLRVEGDQIDFDAIEALLSVVNSRENS